MSNGDALVAFGEWIHGSEWLDGYLDYEGEFSDFFDDLTKRSFVDSLQRLDKDYLGSLTTVFLESYLASDPTGEILKKFRQSGYIDLSQGQLAYLREIWRSTPSLYEVLESVAGSHIVLRDTIRDGSPVQVTERSASENLTKWDILLTRVVTVKGVTQISGGTMILPRESWPFLTSEIGRQIKALTRKLPQRDRENEHRLAEVRDEAAHSLSWYALASWLVAATPRPDERPQLVNKDGDEIEMISLAFPMKASAAEIATVLGESTDFSVSGDLSWSWLIDIKDESIVHGMLRIEGDRLLAETNSVNRGTRLTERLSGLLGNLIGTPIKLETSLEQASKVAPPPGPDLMETLDPVQRQALAAHLHKTMFEKFMRTIDEVVPMLGASPRELVRSKAGREKVANWLKLIENSHAHAPKEFRQVDFDFTPFWKELGLLEYRV
ncbi:MAG: hypothetical protein P4L46_02965 [Fimbriimonas sp.]|nr:hypothetical protein [Fimbriimonas sp.]